MELWIHSNIQITLTPPLASDDHEGRQLGLLPIHLVNGCLKLVLDRPPLELKGRGDEARVRHPDLGAELDLGRDLELLQPILFSVNRENLEDLRHEARIIADVLVGVRVGIFMVEGLGETQQGFLDWHDKCDCIGPGIKLSSTSVSKI